ncbi:SDR family NAD(P)-dependent oxidoreductase [Arthrobacter sp. NQ4]|uniref:SDR family NAD(P)-dependent oxidoreductase n=1 Tax=Arthrobacter sp. NQ4 TaxID=3027930 RepID=UPI0023AF5B3B|nr:SDR family oxidoreductase [Arthrobacter sp. NQ4]MDE8586065.1 SDR family NAD(P)-dependent oxidoreductase [Arthrobacter sp. NQ4]
MSTTPLNILVTGAGGGMCRGINARLAAAGHTIVCVDLNAEATEAAAQTIRDAGGTAHAFAGDVADEAAVGTLHAEVSSAVGPVHALVNAAGILDRRYLADSTAESFRRALDVNLVGPFNLIKAFSPGMIEAGWGRIINIASIAAVTGYPYPSYAASKAGLANLTRSLLEDFWGTGITINSICPGVVDTPMVIQEVRDQVRRRVPTQTIIEPAEIGAMIAFLLTDEARNINGADLLIDGGATRLFSLFNNHAD